MIWIIIGIVIVVVLLKSNKKSEPVYIETSTVEDDALIYAKFSAVFPEKLKPLLKEEFPEFESTFTTSFCSMLWTETVKFMMEKSGETNEISALQKMGEVYESIEDKDALDNEMDIIWKQKFPVEFYTLLESDKNQREKVDQALELAMSQTVAEMG